MRVKTVSVITLCLCVYACGYGWSVWFCRMLKDTILDARANGCVCAHRKEIRIRETKREKETLPSFRCDEGKPVIYHKVKLAAVVFAIIVYKFAKLLHCLLLKSDQIRLEMSKSRTTHTHTHTTSNPMRER